MLLTIFVWGSGPGPAGPTCETVQPARSLLALREADADNSGEKPISESYHSRGTSLQYVGTLVYYTINKYITVQDRSHSVLSTRRPAVGSRPV